MIKETRKTTDWMKREENKDGREKRRREEEEKIRKEKLRGKKRRDWNTKGRKGKK